MTDDDAWDVVNDVRAATFVLATSHGLESAFAPVTVSEDRSRLAFHLARANPWWREASPGHEVLAFFVAASTYVSPLQYPSRTENPHVVPTWNYVMVQIRGTLRIHDDESWKLSQVRGLTQDFERQNDPPWRVDDMDDAYRAAQLSAIVGLELDILSVEGKAKLSQNRPEVDRRAVQSHLATGTPPQQIVADRMNRLR